ncbi:hypothetical protein QE367_002539 [Microbacterium paludicola]|uniref:Uncharacterized protein n=1 Tax=Microbacterium paludicola TaxID=300019 RepID=A0ABU1I382_9MICO|nr:hypothetical protein [Microbacterium paludicola]MDR6168335.1 hypothetical protein [Microbacterium paludicola]
MDSEMLLLAVALVVIAAVTGTLAVVARDGYRRVPTDATRVPPRDEAAPTRPTASRRRVEGSAEVSGRGAHGRDAMPRAVATPIPPR